MVIAFIIFIFATYKAIQIVNKTYIGTDKGTYVSYVSSSKEIKDKAYKLVEDCQDDYCKVQALLDFTSNIPYSTNTFQQNSPQNTIQKNFGDCDDKSNLLISMLHLLGIEAYFVLVPKHIFVIVPLYDNRLSKTKGLWINNRKFYILESTSKGSRIGFPLHYSLDEIDTIINPFENKKIEIRSISYKR